jgi:hypothetical protein
MLKRFDVFLNILPGVADARAEITFERTNDRSASVFRRVFPLSVISIRGCPFARFGALRSNILGLRLPRQVFSCYECQGQGEGFGGEGGGEGVGCRQ